MRESFYKFRDDFSELFKKNIKNISKSYVLQKELDVCNVRWLIWAVALTVAFYVGCMPETAKAPGAGGATQETPNRPTEDAQAKILAALQEQNRLMKLEREEAQAEKNWVAMREKFFQSWASFKAEEQQQLEKSIFDIEQEAASDQASIDGLSGKGKVGPVRFWRPTYGKWYPKYLEEYRKVCGTMSEDELMNYARAYSLPWYREREFVGIGIGLDKNSAGLVESVYVGSPSEKSGIQKGDRVTRVDGKSTADMTIEQVAELIRGQGQRGTSVRLDVVSPSSPIPREIVLERDLIK